MLREPSPIPNLSRLLGRIALLGADWARIEVGPGQGFAMPAGDHAVAHFLTQGTLLLQVEQGAPIALSAGGTAILPHARAHHLRQEGSGTHELLRYFDEVHDIDIPPTLGIRTQPGQPAAVVLSAQLHFDWPIELPRTRTLPPVLLGTRSYRVDQSAAIGAARALDTTAVRAGGSICLSRFAELLLVRELRDVLIAHPELMDLRDETAATIVRAIDAVRMKPSHPWTVEGLARHVGMSRSTFAAAFKAVHDKGPMELVAEKRMEIAARMLRESNMRVKTVAAKVGYSSDTAFLRRFTAYFGISPTAYKRQHEAAQHAHDNDWLTLLR